MPDGKIYVGWIYGDPSDAAQLKALGVKGKMLWKASSGKMVTASGKTGIFSHCECTEDVIGRLEKEYPGFSDTFSPVTKEEYSEYRRENYNEVAEQALELWKRWFKCSGDPWLPFYGSEAEDCFFCSEDKPNHEPDCVYIAAKQLVTDD